MRWHVYPVMPVDRGWEHLRTVTDTVALIQDDDHFPVAAQTLSAADFNDIWKSAQQAALSRGWEGDFRGEPHVLWVLTADGFRPGFLFKQDNNGDSFVVSPVEIRSCEATGY